MGDHILQMSWIGLYALHTSTGAVVIKFADMEILFSTRNVLDGLSLAESLFEYILPVLAEKWSE